MKEIFDKFYKDFPSAWVKGINYEISRFHRIQVSEGYKKAIKEISYILKNEKIKFKVHKFPFTENSKYFFLKFFPYWKIKKGYLKIIEPFTGVICDYNETPLSVIPRSRSVQGVYEIVDSEKFRGNINKKILLTTDFRKRMYDIYKKDTGILYYGMPKLEGIREEGEIEDAIHYVSFWEKGFFGFAVSPAKGRKIKNLLKKHKKLKAEVLIETEFGEREIEVIDILFKGEENNELWCISHLCHPAPFANDNASGCAVSLGIAKYLNEEIKRGNLKLKRNIRILLLPEMTGTVAFLKSNPELVKKVIASINLDMVGEDQNKCLSVMQVEREPFFIRSFACYIGEYILTIFPEKAKNFHGSTELPVFRKVISEYSGGSDHYILISPDIGIPSIMINYWPDKFYHTTADTIDKVSKESLHLSGTFTLTYLTFLSDISKKDLNFIKEKMKQIFKRKIYDLKIKEEKEEKFINEYKGFINALYSLKKLDNTLSVEDDIREINEFCKSENIPKELNERFKIKKKFILRKRYKTVPFFITRRLKVEERKEFNEKVKKIKKAGLIIDLLSYLSDGRREISDILNNLKIEIGEFDPKDVFYLINILERVKFLERK